MTCISEAQTDEVVILDDKEDGMDEEMDYCMETRMDDDEGTEEEKKGQRNMDARRS